MIFKGLYGLDYAVLCQAEVFDLEVGDGLSVAVSHQNVQNDEADIGAQFCRGALQFDLGERQWRRRRTIGGARQGALR